MAIVGIIPAAGHATRLQPLRGSKELLQVGGRPVIDYLLDRLKAGGCATMRLVTRSDKTDLIEFARRRHLEVVVGNPPTLGSSIALGLEGLDPGWIALVGLPDSIWEPSDGFAILRAVAEAQADLVLGLFRSAEPARSDVVEVDDEGIVTAVIRRPDRPSSPWIWGCFAARVGALEDLADAGDPGILFGDLARHRRVHAVRLGQIIDIGTPEALARARAGAAVSRAVVRNE